MDIVANACADGAKYAGLRCVTRALQAAYRQRLIRRPFRSQFLGLVAQVHRQRSVKARLTKYHQTSKLRQTARKVASLIDQHVHRPDIFKHLNIKLSEKDEEHAVGYLSEGNEAFYTSPAIIRRGFLVRDLFIREVTAMFWTLASEDGERVTKTEYKRLMVYIAKVLVSGALSDEEIDAAIDHDWKKDLKKSRIANDDATASTLSPADLHCSLYELADVWVDGIDGAKYADFLKNLLYSVASRTKRGLWLFRELKDVASIMDKDGQVNFQALSKARLDVIVEPNVGLVHQVKRNRRGTAALRFAKAGQEAGGQSRPSRVPVRPRGRSKQNHVQQSHFPQQPAVSIGTVQRSATGVSSKESYSKTGQLSNRPGSPVPRKTLAVESPDKAIGLRSGGRGMGMGHGLRNRRQCHKKTAPQYVLEKDSSSIDAHANSAKWTSTIRQVTAFGPAIQIRALDCRADHDQQTSPSEQRTHSLRPHTQQTSSRKHRVQHQRSVAGAVSAPIASTNPDCGSPPAASRGRSVSSGTIHGSPTGGATPSTSSDFGSPPAASRGRSVSSGTIHGSPTGGATLSTSSDCGSPPTASRGRSFSPGTTHGSPTGSTTMSASPDCGSSPTASHGQSSSTQWSSGSVNEASSRQHPGSIDSRSHGEEYGSIAGLKGMTRFGPAPIELQLSDSPALQSHPGRGKHAQDPNVPRTFGAHFHPPAQRQQMQYSQHSRGLQSQSRHHNQSPKKDDSFDVYYSPERRNFGAAMTKRRGIFKSSLSRTCDSGLLERARRLEKTESATTTTTHLAPGSAGSAGSSSMASSSPARLRPSTMQQQVLVHSAQVTGLRSFLPPTKEAEDGRTRQFSGPSVLGVGISPTWENPRGLRGHVRRLSDPSPIAAHARHASHHRGWSTSSHPLPDLKVPSPDSRDDLSPIEHAERISPVAQARKELPV
eukprot:INCI3299.1.p1 GENE.INCI3299.1~~INCI3299.1.p1  ORF type:complete len:936 (+),score=110.45 INCI3299.1:265-3072(+)